VCKSFDLHLFLLVHFFAMFSTGSKSTFGTHVECLQNKFVLQSLKPSAHVKAQKNVFNKCDSGIKFRLSFCRKRSKSL
jgi:hypothetical protein